MERRVTEVEKHNENLGMELNEAKTARNILERDNGLLKRELQEADAEKSEFEAGLHQSIKEKVVLKENWLRLKGPTRT